MTDQLIVYMHDLEQEIWVADLYRDGEFVYEVVEDS